MNYQTLYRKYRPNSFELVFGQEIITKTLTNVIKNNKLCHAYLFTGPRGTGKTSCAKLFAKAINCLNNENGDACNQCEICNAFNNNPDIIEIDAASNNGVDEIREIRSKINLVPSFSKYKVYIIDEVHMLSTGAFNALLKTLEEPPNHVVFILATTEPQKLPATIISRCQRFDFKSITNDKMKNCLNRIINLEKINIDDDAIEEIIINSNGGMRDAIGLLDQANAFSDDLITKKNIIELNGSISDEQIIKFLNNIIKSNYENTLKTIKEWNEAGKDFTIISQNIITFLQKGIIYKKINKSSDNFSKEFYDKSSDSLLYNLLDEFSNIITKLEINFQKCFIYEVNIMRIIDSLSSNVSRETSKEKISVEENDVPRGTSEQVNTSNQNNVSRETLNSFDENASLKEKLKKIRINNIILNSTKTEKKYIEDNWNKINNYLLDDKYKTFISILINSKVVAASNDGIIVSIQNKIFLQKMELSVDKIQYILEEIYNKKYNIVILDEGTWKNTREIYIEKIKNKTLEYIDEKDIIEKIKNNNNNKSVNQFTDLIETEELI